MDCLQGTDETPFDIVIVGSSAGGVLAARLSEHDNLRILLLEAGDDHRTATMSREMKAVNPMNLWADPTWTWSDSKVSRTHAQLPRFYPVGRGLGGGSAMNGMGAIRPSKEDFDEWETQGCDGWGWNEMLPCLCRLEKDPMGDVQPDLHGSAGPIPIYRLPVEKWGPVAAAMRSSALDQGYGESPDINSPVATGCVSFAYNVAADRESPSLIEQYHPQEYVWEVNSWAEPEGGYMIWPCCRALAENAPGCQERAPAAVPPTQAPDEHSSPGNKDNSVIRVVVSSSNPVKVRPAPCDAATCLTHTRCPPPSD